MISLCSSKFSLRLFLFPNKDFGYNIVLSYFFLGGIWNKRIKFLIKRIFKIYKHIIFNQYCSCTFFLGWYDFTNFLWSSPLNIFIVRPLRPIKLYWSLNISWNSGITVISSAILFFFYLYFIAACTIFFTMPSLRVLNILKKNSLSFGCISLGQKNIFLSRPICSMTFSGFSSSNRGTVHHFIAGILKYGI